MGPVPSLIHDVSLQSRSGHLRISDHHPTNAAQPTHPSHSVCSFHSMKPLSLLISFFCMSHFCMSHFILPASPQPGHLFSCQFLMTLSTSIMLFLSLFWSYTELCSRNAHSCHTVMSLKSFKLSLPWSSQPHMLKVSHPVMQTLLMVEIATHYHRP